MRLQFTVLLTILVQTIFAQYPEGFAEEIAYNEFSAPVGIFPASEDLAFVIELNGEVWAIHNGIVDENPILNISDEVGKWADLGLISAALDPDFLNNGYIYLLYNVDRYHLMHSNDADYDPNEDDYYQGGMGRVTRYTVNTDGFNEIDEGSRLIVLGETIGSGIPLCSDSHGLGTILFGEDGSLLISTGDTNSYYCCYNGDGPIPAAAYDSISYNDGILRADELIGAFRSQYIDGLNGKVLRIHPLTGEGLASNPFFDETNPDNARSKVWALGFRNPFRFTIKPGTGYGGLDDGHPGIIYLTDVGETKWEELNIIRDPGKNYGWPIYEGQDYHVLGYPELTTYNPSALNPLYQSGGCNQEFFSFQELLVQENQQHNYFFPNPCNPSTSIPDDIATFSHERPAIAYRNGWAGPNETYTPTFNEDGVANYTSISSPESSLIGETFKGFSGNGGTFISGENIPEEYQDHFVLSDYAGWVRDFSLNEGNDFTTVEMWEDSIGRAAFISQNPFDGCIYICTLYPSYIKRICFGGNLKPVVILNPDTVYGQSPLVVVFDASSSYDPEGEALDFEWDFDDGSTGTGSQTSHEFIAPNGQVEKFEVKLTVTDQSGAFTVRNALVSLNNTPPSVEIISITEGELYSNRFPTPFDLVAETIDQEHPEWDIEYDWTYMLRHNTHFHILDYLSGNNRDLVVYPTACDQGEDYWYEINVVATDPGGLVSRSYRNIYPDCDGVMDIAPENGADYIFSPNPSSNVMQLRSYVGLDEQMAFTIYSTDGKLVSKIDVEVYNNRNDCEIDISHLMQGVYIIDFSIDGTAYRERIMKIN